MFYYSHLSPFTRSKTFRLCINSLYDNYWVGHWRRTSACILNTRQYIYICIHSAFSFTARIVQHCSEVKIRTFFSLSSHELHCKYQHLYPYVRSALSPVDWEPTSGWFKYFPGPIRLPKMGYLNIDKARWVWFRGAYGSSEAMKRCSWMASDTAIISQNQTPLETPK